MAPATRETLTIAFYDREDGGDAAFAQVTRGLLVETDFAPGATREEFDDPRLGGWTVASDPALDQLAVWRHVGASGDGMAFVPDYNKKADHSLVSPPIAVGTDGDLVLSFTHLYRFDIVSRPYALSSKLVTTDTDAFLDEHPIQAIRRRR